MAVAIKISSILIITALLTQVHLYLGVAYFVTIVSDIAVGILKQQEQKAELQDFIDNYKKSMGYEKVEKKPNPFNIIDNEENDD